MRNRLFITEKIIVLFCQNKQLVTLATGVPHSQYVMTVKSFKERPFLRKEYSFKINGQKIICTHLDNNKDRHICQSCWHLQSVRKALQGSA